MKTKMNVLVSMMSILCLLVAFLAGCSSEEVIDVLEATSAPLTENYSKPSQEQKKEQPMDVAEVGVATIPDEDIEVLLQAAMDVIAEESDLWAVSEITDSEILMQLTQSRGGKERSGKGESVPEAMPSSDSEDGQQPNGERPEGTMPKRDGSNTTENKDGSSHDREKTAFGQDRSKSHGEGRGEGNGSQSSNRRGGMAALAIVISGAENATLAAEDIFEQIQLAAEMLEYQASNMELTDEQRSIIEVPNGHSVKTVVLISAQIPEVETQESVG